MANQGEIATDKSAEPAGVLGDGAARPGKYNMALMRRAISSGWEIPPEVRQSVVTQMAKTVEKGRSNRDKVAAARVLVAADSINARLEALKTPRFHLHGGSVNVDPTPAVDATVEQRGRRIITLAERLRIMCTPGATGGDGAGEHSSADGGLSDANGTGDGEAT